MVAVAEVLEPTGAAPTRARRPVGRWLVLGGAGLYFGLPLWGAVRFCLRDASGHWTLRAVNGLPGQPGFAPAIGLTARLAAVTTVLTLLLVVPTAVWVHLRAPSLRRLLDGLTVLPVVIPPVVLIVGVLQVSPTALKGTPYLLALEYVVLAMPFAYRALDAGLRGLDLRTLVDASRSLGARAGTTLLHVVLPNLRSAVLSATVLTVALVLGEYTMAALDQYQTFPVWVVAFDQDDARTSVAASLAALLLTWAVLMVLAVLGDRRRRSRP